MAVVLEPGFQVLVEAQIPTFPDPDQSLLDRCFVWLLTHRIVSGRLLRRGSMAYWIALRVLVGEGVRR